MPFKRIWQSCPVSKGGDYVESLSCLRHVWRMWTFRLYHHHQNFPELLYCPAGHCHWCGELLFAVIYSKLFPPLERDTDGRALWGDNCCVIAVTGKSEDRLSIFFTMIWICFVSPEYILKLNNCGTVRVEPLCCLDVQPSGLDLGKVFRWDSHNWILVAVKENRVGWRCISMLKPSPSKCKALELIPKLGRNQEGKARGCTQFPYLLQVVPCIFLGLLSMRSHSTLEQKDKTKKSLSF